MARSTPARGRSPQPPVASGSKSKKNTSYKSEGVENNDVFLLPVSDYVVSFFLTVLAAIVRVFRIYQPSSVVFDEVQ
jgi:dolichyl-phosphate-mannose-protein mannosyltransferase